MRKVWLFLLVLITTASYAQQGFEVRGVIADSAGQPLSGANVKILYGTDSLQAMTSKTGTYTIAGVNKPDFTLIASYSGLQSFSQSFTKTSTNPVFQVTPIMLFPAEGTLEGIVIKSTRTMIVKEDTVQFDAGAYKVREGAPVEDVIKKLPGVTVDKDGNIETQGKKVSRVRVNGKDFFGGDVQTATQNLPADIIDNIQIIDDYGDQANISGIKSGEPEKIININTQRNKNKGYFGNATVAAGSQGRYGGNLFANRFNEDQQISLLGAINNTNANLFNFNGGGRGGGARGANLGSEGRSGPAGNGITLSRSIGANYRDKWGEKISVYGSYSFSDRSTDMTNSSYSQDFNPSNIRSTKRDGSSHNSSFNHRLTWNLEYAMDSLNYFKVSPYVSYNSSGNEGASYSETSKPNYFTVNNSLNQGGSESLNGGGNVLFNHRFKKRGRNFSANVVFDRSTSNNDRYSANRYHNVDSTLSPIFINDTAQIQNLLNNTNNTRTNANMSYSEPLNATGTMQVEVNYDWNKSATESQKEVYDYIDSLSKNSVFNDRQSNHYQYDFITNKAGLSLRGRSEKYNYSAGVRVQSSSLSGHSVERWFSTNYTNINWIPSLRFVYNFARNNSLTATLDGAAREPNFFQLQPIADSSNLNNIVVGNPNLKNEFTHTMMLRYNRFDSKSGNSFFINFSYNRTSDKIVSSRYNSTVGTARTTTYLNTDGFEGFSGSASFTKPFAERKYTAGVSINGNYDNNISYTDGLKNRGSNWNLRPGASFRVDLDNRMDVTLRGDYTAYQTTTRYAFTKTTTTTKAQTLSLGLNGKNYFGDLTVGYDLTKTVNYGFASSTNVSPFIVGCYTEYRFLKGKMMTVRLQAFDLLNDNTGISRTVNETTITDNRAMRLARYFLVTANLRLAKFGGGVKRSSREGNSSQNRFQGNNSGNEARF